MPSLSRPACLCPRPSALVVHARGSGSGSNVTQSQTGARDVISLVPVCSVFPFRPLVRRWQQHHCSYIKITYIRMHVPLYVCVCVYIDENSFNAPHVLAPSSPFTFCFFSLLPFILRTFLCSLPFAASFTFHMATPCLLVYPLILFALPFAE